MNVNPEIMLPLVFNPYGAAPLVTTTFGCLAASYDSQIVCYSKELETEGRLFTKLDGFFVELVTPRLRLFWLDQEEVGDEGEDEWGAAEEAGDKPQDEASTADDECKLVEAPLSSVGLLTLEDAFKGRWWVSVLEGQTRRELEDALRERVEDAHEGIACRTAAASVLAKLTRPTVKLPPDVISYMLDCRLAMNSLEFRMRQNGCPPLLYLAKKA